MLCWMNGEYVEHDELKISPFDHGFLYGLGFFETFRTYNGKPLFIKEHLTRLQEALSAFHISFPYTAEQLVEVIEALNAADDGKDGYFRLNVSAGEHEIGLAPSRYEHPNVIVFRKSLPPVISGLEKTATILQTRRNVPENGETRFKGHHYGNNVLARFELPSLAMQEGIFLTTEGFVAEGITSNVFWVKDGVVYTPSLDTGILAGITRSLVLELIHQLGYSVQEGQFHVSELLEAEECFITNSVQQIVPIRSLGAATYLGNKGEVTKAIQRAYEQLVELRLKGDLDGAIKS